MGKRGRFRWTRAKYKRASHLARLLPHMPGWRSTPPLLVQRYFDLCEQYPQGTDPLTVPLRWRHPSDDVPF
ncbi:hypothetical protein [Acidovorax sp. NCPPB 4044]|uniref:hypothetical protein n=1 Tax=Acidovorax sp. NCPPB 4044 TaxID=2940490 RepID=UPI002304C723|nr:hypothetical protein [Acidovorax sp. NCPPB 4044]MDA8522022.1 hypothetical protein [Acidovorax sp. NCPPB 4044]